MNPFFERKTIWFWQIRRYPNWEIESGWIRLNIRREVYMSDRLKSHVSQSRAKWGMS
jgi:hypothetical protein